MRSYDKDRRPARTKEKEERGTLCAYTTERPFSELPFSAALACLAPFYLFTTV